MKKLWIGVVVVLMLGMFGTTSNAMSIADVAAANTTLTVVFGAPAEFDAVPMAKAEMNAIAASPVTTNNSGPSQPGPGPSAVPEPSTLILVGLGVLGILGLARRKKR